nr:MAG TPA: hypothetical protein [Caudoviricetes sp.]
MWASVDFPALFYSIQRTALYERMKIMLHMHICIFHVCKLVFSTCKVNMRPCLQHTKRTCLQVSV